MAQWLKQVSQGYEVYCPWSEGHGFEPGQVELRVRNTSVCRTWATNVNYQYIILRDLHMLTSDLRDNVAVHAHFF